MRAPRLHLIIGMLIFLCSLLFVSQLHADELDELLNTDLASLMEMQVITPARKGQTEIIAGPSSSLYGANAYAGLINVITRRASQTSEGLTLETTGLLGNHTTRSPEIFAQYRFKNGLSLQLAGRWYKSDGDSGINRPDPGSYFHNNLEPTRVLTSEHGNIANQSTPIPDGFRNNRASELDIGVRMGIHSGEGIVGNFGSADRMEYTIIGLKVNIAARLEENSNTGCILISEATYNLVKDTISCKPRGEITAKGIDKNVMTYWVNTTDS